MGENNGNVGNKEIPTQQELDYMKETLNRLYQENIRLKETWVLHRVNFLFQGIKEPMFSEEFKKKAVQELEEYLYPTKEEIKESKETKE